MEAAYLSVGDKLVLEGGIVEELDKTSKEYCDKPVKVYNFEVEDFHTYFVGDSNILVHNKCNEGWIKRDTYNEIRESFGNKAAKKFANSMKKGLVGKEGNNGIKALSGVIKKGGVKYTHEIKIKGMFGNARVYGYFDEKSKQYVFSYFVKKHM